MASAKRDLQAGEYLDGEGGNCVWAKAVPARLSDQMRALPIGLAHHVKLKHAVRQDQEVTMDHVELLDVDDILRFRQHMRAVLNVGRNENRKTV